ncbi:Gfo/Idh/MocA family protein [Streptomyces monticola]|uniref:Gfo/Idh/MocA family protein n=1 Tax=Streptomyces monticola TaxID=2666263 RepID=A0ABW2JQ94_9ACTN
MRVGLLSFAHTHAARYAQLLRAMPGIELLTSDPDITGAGPREVRGAALAGQLGVAYAEDYAELFAWGPDAVIVTAENSRHRELVEMAARHGADVLCEKPLATTAEDGAAMVDACRAAGVRLAVAYPVRFSPAYAALRDAVRSGRTGRVLSVTGANNGRLPADVRRWFVDPHLAGGGALMDHTVHVADLMDDLFDGARAVEVYAQANNLLYAESVAVDTAGLVVIRYDNGVVVTVDCSWSQPLHAVSRDRLELQLVGAEATVDADFFGQLVSGFDEKNHRPMDIPWGTDVNEELLKAFLSGPGERVVPLADGESALRSLKIVLAGYASLRSGQPAAIR